MLLKTALAGLAASALLMGLAPAHADFPDKPIRIVVPVSPGGGTDITARMLATHLSARLNVPVIVENKLGADGIIGADFVAKAPPDGYTLLIPTTGHFLLPFINKKMPYDTMKDLVGITAISRAPMVIVASPQLPFKTPKEFVELLRANPNKYGYATFESYGQLLIGMMNAKSNVQALRVPYKGSGQALPDVISGVVHYTMTSVAAAKTFVESGKLKAVALTGGKPVPELPGVVSLHDAGLLDVDVFQRFTLFAPARTPREVLDKLQQAVNAVVHSPEVTKSLRLQAQEPIGNSVADFQAEVQKEYAMSEKSARDAGLVPQ